MRAIAVWLVLAGCGRFGFGADDAVDAPGGVDATPRVTFQVDVLLFARLDTCLVGDACSGNGCIALADDAGVPVIEFRNNTNFAAVAPGDPRIENAAVSQCVSTALDAMELAYLRGELATFAADVATWSGGTIALDVRVHELSLGTAMSGTDTLWVSHGDAQQLAAGRLSAATDFVLLTHDVRDDATGLHLPFGFCGLEVGADFGPAGAGYSWVPRTMSATFFECATADSYTIQWLAQLEFALRGLAGAVDIYGANYPACGMAAADPHEWFPSSLDCLRDPDWTLCGLEDCGGGYEQHILEAHWVPGSATLGNHCRDGIANYGETGVDTGGVCL